MLQPRRKYQCSRRFIDRGGSSLPSIMKTGLRRTGKGCCGQMRPRLTGLDLMGKSMSGNNVGNHHLTALQHQLLNMEGEITLWCGAVWVGWGGKAYRGSGEDGC